MLGNVGVDRRYQLRWRFDFHARRAPRLGPWDDNGGGQAEKFGTSAWCTNKDGLSRAAVEAQDAGSPGAVYTLAECDGWDFVNFEWRRALPAPLGLMGLKQNALEAIGPLVGLTLVTREKIIRVTVDGSKQIWARTPQEKQVHLAGFGR